MPRLLPPPLPARADSFERMPERRLPCAGFAAVLLSATTWLGWLWADGADLSAANGYLGFVVVLALTVYVPLAWVAALALGASSLWRREGHLWIPLIGLLANAAILRALFE